MAPGELLGAGRIRELLRFHRVMLTKSLGQNFVIDPNTIRKIVDTAEVGADDRVLEVGAGAGSLTLELARRARTVTAFEVDERLKPILDETLADVSNAEILYRDVLSVDLSTVDATRVVANLPYNIAAQTVIKILQESPASMLCVMTQREVGERLAAGPGAKTYGLTSVLVGFYATASVAGRISRSVFFPVPDVDSVLVRIVRRDRVPNELGSSFTAIARAAFAQRRKSIKNSLASIASSADIDRALSDASIEPSARPETMSVADFIAVTRVLTS